LRLFHFSDRGDIAVFEPRPPERHPEAESFVYAINSWHAPLYLFPRDCPRIGVWPVETTLDKDISAFRDLTSARMRLLIDSSFERSWREKELFRYEFDPADGFIDCQDHGVWVSRSVVAAQSVVRLTNLPSCIEDEGIQVEIVASLAESASEFYDFEAKQFRTSLHVSMVRMALLPGWNHQAGRPVRPTAI